MRGTLDQSDFQEAVTLVQGITQTKLSNPVVENIVLRFGEEEAEILATNLSISIRIKMKVETAEPGEIAMPARLLGALVRELPPGPVEINLEEREVRIEAGRSHFHINVMTTEDFPPFLPEIEGPVIELPVEVAAQAMKRTVFATSNERARYQLGGVRFVHKEGTIRWVATDGRRLSTVKHGMEDPVGDDCSMLIPSRAIQELLRSLPDTGILRTTIGTNRVLFECENITIASTLLDENFPPYEGLLRSDFAIQIRVDRDDLMAAARRASVLANERTRLVHLASKGDSLIVTGERQEAGGAESEVDAETGGHETTASYNASYLLDCLGALGPGKAVWALVQEKGAAYFFKDEEDSFLHIIMPLTIKEEESTPSEEDEEEDND